MYGNSSNVIHTPQLDALAYQGVRLENYYVQPVCSPTRSCIMTGRYVFHTGIHTPFMDATQNALLLDEVTVAQRLKSAGYATHAVGKWHLGFKTWKYTPQERGFDSFFGYYGGSTDYYTMDTLCWPDSQCFTSETPDHEALSGWDLHRDRAVIRNSTEYSTVLFTAEAERVMAEHAATAAGTPLFLYLPYQAVCGACF
jgi:arylsulfatase B/arylsulfatase I/J